MPILIKLKKGHPTGTFRRDGLTVTYGKSVVADSVSEKVKNEAWFEVSKIAKEPADKLVASGAAMDLRVPVKEKNEEKETGDKK